MRLTKILVALLLLCLALPVWAIPPLHEAARDGRIDDIRRLVAENPNILDQRDDDGNTALHWAVAMGQTVVVEYLLGQGVSVDITKTDAANKIGEGKWTPLHQAAHNGQVDCLKILLRYRPNLLARDQNDQTPLHIAAWDNQIEAAKLLIDAGIPVNVTRKDRVIPLEIASYFGHIDMLKMLIARGGDVRWHVYDGYTPLHQAARGGRWEAMQILIENGADIEARRDNGQTPLHDAVDSGKVWESNFLLTAGADPNAKSIDGTTPLGLAQRNGRGETAALLQAYLNAQKEMNVLMEARRLNRNNMPSVKNLVEKVVYKNEFEEEAPGEEWSTTTTGASAGLLKTSEIPNAGKRFLGEFADQNVRLTLTKLPAHSGVTVVLTLFVINHWNGGGIRPTPGPSIWEANVEGGPTLLRSTFANTEPDWKNTPIQSFPGDYTVESHPGYTGALAHHLLHLGATKENPEGKPDAVYRVHFTFAHSKPLLMLNFLGKNLENIGERSWGIRNIEVRVTRAVTTPAKPAKKR